MSLNGLDNVQVTQAYQGALAEAGGWFLLRYTSRDEVEVHTRGTGGAGEARAAVAAYEEKSPLYGLLLYRRRKILVKYVPEGTSRLLQARVTVHFLTITDRFAPCDVIISASTPEELSDAALAAACQLHTAAPSISSSSGSSRPQKLSWIQETAEEAPSVFEDSAAVTPPVETPAPIPTISEPVKIAAPEHLRTASVISQTSESVPVILDSTVVEPQPPQVKSHIAPEIEHEEPVTPASDLSELQETLKSYDKLFEGGPEPRPSTQTARPNYDELYDHYYAQYSKPKVKLGPRPRPSLDNRPSTSGGSSKDVARPKSSLPPGLRSGNKTKEKKSQRTRDLSIIPSIALPPPPPIPATPEMPHSPVSPAYTSKSPMSVKSMPVSAYSSHRSHGMTQEKTRLMKALEMRKKQQKAQVERQAKQQEEAAAQAKVPLQDSTAQNANLEVPKPAEMKAEKPAEHEEVAPSEEKENVETVIGTQNVDDSSSSLEASGMVFTGSQTDPDDLNSSVSVSSPISAQTQGSSGAPSTRPSSVSEDDKSVTEHSQKLGDIHEIQVPDLRDDEKSVESTPTVVPESITPVPTQTSEAGSSVTSPVTDISDQREPENLEVPHDEPTSQSQRRTNRESAIYMPTISLPEDDEAQTKRRNRESVLLPNSKRQSWYQTKEKRRAVLDPLHVSAENSEAEYLSDDSFMEELQSATVHEAKPLFVSNSKSPVNPFFPGNKSTTELSSTPTRSVSQGYQVVGRLSPEQAGRKLSGVWPPPSQSDVVVAKKINVSSGISQRIKALAEKSNRESMSGASIVETPKSTLAQRKSSFFATTPVDTSPPSRPASRSRLGNSSFLNPPGSSATTPEKKVQPIKATVYNVQREPERAESVQVTARIVRDERSMMPPLTMPNDTTPLDLHASQLTIDHQRPTFNPKSPMRGRAPSSPTAPSLHSREQSSSRASMESTWRTFGRRMSESRSLYSHDGEDKFGDRKDKKDKKESRTSKMFKRMSSSISSMPWKNSSTNLNLPEQDVRTTSLASLREPPPAVHVGDLNIQFPDTLLWKRRWVEIDSSGNLVLSPSKSNEKGVVKRFHLSEFRTPYPPDLDRQELPNSVVLDFVDGRTLQCACETYAAQAQVLQILREAHDAWLAYNQAL